MASYERSGLTAEHRPTSRKDRRLLGAFYTPYELAHILVQWALQPGPGTLLDPSFGGCSFMRAAIAVLRAQGVRSPEQDVFGVDVDPACIEHVKSSESVVPANCLTADFLQLEPSSLSGFPFTAVVGNPPYLRHHWLKGLSLVAARRIAATLTPPLPATANSWAYFLIHAVSFLAPNGRLAFLVPEAILQADFARSVRQFLLLRFASVRLIHLSERVFDGTAEPVVVVIADGNGPGRIEVDAVKDCGSLSLLLGKGRNPGTSVPITNQARLLPPYLAHLTEGLLEHNSVHGLGDLAEIRIGLVTGANDFFLTSRDEARRQSIPAKAVVPVIARSRWLAGLRFTKEEHRRLLYEGCRGLLIRPTPATVGHNGIMNWIRRGLSASVQTRYKCLVRRPWYEVSISRPPDAIASCTRLGPPILALNPSRARPTNALHTVCWRNGLNFQPEAVVVGYMTSFVAFWAELHGRRYGGGVLKLEPGTLSPKARII